MSFEEPFTGPRNNCGRPNNLTGLRFGKLVALKAVGTSPKRGVVWLCQCDCGAQKHIHARNLRKPHQGTKSCGCLRKPPTPRVNGIPRKGLMLHVKHADTYTSWRGMRQRCASKGGIYASITCCERWAAFEQFLKDMGERPAGMTLDRIDSKGNYEPTNCRWATREEQSRNRSIVKITVEIAAAIKGVAADGESAAVVAARFGVRTGAVNDIWAGRRWISVPAAA